MLSEPRLGWEWLLVLGMGFSLKNRCWLLLPLENHAFVGGGGAASKVVLLTSCGAPKLLRCGVYVSV